MSSQVQTKQESLLQTIRPVPLTLSSSKTQKKLTFCKIIFVIKPLEQHLLHWPWWLLSGRMGSSRRKGGGEKHHTPLYSEQKHPALEESVDVAHFELTSHSPPLSHSGVGQPLSLALRNVCVFFILFQRRTEVASTALSVPIKQSQTAPCPAPLMLPCTTRREMAQRNYNQLLGSLPQLGFAVIVE